MSAVSFGERRPHKGIGMSVDEPQSLLVPSGFVVALVASIVALCVVATGALVVPARAQLAAKISLALVAAGYAVPVLMLLAALVLRRAARLGALALLVTDIALVFVFAAQPWSLVLAALHLLGGALCAIGAAGGRAR